MNVIYLSDYKAGDDRERIAAALADAERRPGTTVCLEGGEYTLTSVRSREICRAVMSGEYGSNPEPVMFSPDFPYDRGIDLDGHVGTVIDGGGAKISVDGFMEVVSIRNCRGVTVRGLEIDTVRKPYTKAAVTGTSSDGVAVTLSQEISPSTPVVRTGVYSQRYARFIPELSDVERVVSVNGKKATLWLKGEYVPDAGDEIYLCHTYHFRPAVLIENAKDVAVEDVTVRSHPGMGLTAFHGEDIALDGFRVIPADGSHFSTNTDATHFTSCRGSLIISNCAFVGQGDDGINVHTYYFTAVSHEGQRAVLRIMSPTWTHTQKMDHPTAGDVLELVDDESLAPADTFRVLSVVVDEKERTCSVELDRELPADMSHYLACFPEMTPDLEVRNTSFRNHFARAMTLKARRCLIENCVAEDLFELPIKLAAERYWREGVSCEEMTVRGCRFINCGKLKYCVPKFECGGIQVFMDTLSHVPVHGKVLIEDNVIECPDCDHGIMLGDLKEAVINNNRITSRLDPIVTDGKVKTKNASG